MGLQGTLQDFGALETFQLIALQQKTGTLEITHEGQRRQFVFENGLLLAAHEAPLRPEGSLVRFLLETRYITEEEARAWVTFPNPQPINPIDLLVKLTDMTIENVSFAYDSFLQTMLDEILTWPRGKFQFNAKKVGIPSKLLGPWKIEGLLMESMRRLDEWADLQAAELPPGLIPRMRGGQASRDVQEPFARALIKGIDGRRSLQEIVETSAVAGYDLFQAVRQLRDQGLIDMIEWVPSGPWMEQLWQRRSRWKSVFFTAGSVVLLLLLTLGVRLFIAHHGGPWPTSNDFSFVTPEVRDARGAYATAQLMEVYRLRHGRYPLSYTDMVADGLISEKTSRDMEPHALRWIVDASGKSYRWDAIPDDSGQAGSARHGQDSSPPGQRQPSTAR
ncbi:MAG: DUF4388 domain-containing protein [Candidatus Eisenbacteria sp.]|nr:DUF4388 domain-containing protein [Candidatus Eisenbacteria bacterium]